MVLVPALPKEESPERDDGFQISTKGVSVTVESGKDVLGTGLKNEVGEYNCFLNVIIQVGISNVLTESNFNFLEFDECHFSVVFLV